MALTNQQQAIVMFVAAVLPAVAAWFAIGAPTDHAALALLGGDFVTGIIFYVKELLGTASPVVPPGAVATTVVTSPAKAS